MVYRDVRRSTLPSLEELADDELLVIEEAAAYLRLSVSTLEKWRSGYRGFTGGPPFIRLHEGRKSPVRYPVGQLREWIAAQTTNPSEGAYAPAQTA